ncbi:MAG: hypothetical protein ACRD6R_10035 [Candidatus Polarisedimenticolia bacterium]
MLDDLKFALRSFRKRPAFLAVAAGVPALGEGMRRAAGGTATGIAGGLALNRALPGLLFGVGPADPWTYLAVAALMSGVAFLACWIPARRATRVDPLVALRSE